MPRRPGAADGARRHQGPASSRRPPATGVGLDELQAAAGQRRRRAHDAARARLAADVRAAPGAARRPSPTPSRPSTTQPRRAARCAGPQRRGADRRRRRRARLPDGGCGAHRLAVHPVGARLRPDPLRLRLGWGSDGRDAARAAPGVTAADVRSALGRSSLPPPTPAARAAVDLATRRLADGRAGPSAPVGGGARTPPPRPGRRWATPSTRRSSAPRCWRARRSGGACFGYAQWLFAAATVVGLVWLLVLGVVGWLRLPEIETPRLGPLPYPFLLLAGGLLFGVLLAALARALARVGARRRAESSSIGCGSRSTGWPASTSSRPSARCSAARSDPGGARPGGARLTSGRRVGGRPQRSCG